MTYRTDSPERLETRSDKRSPHRCGGRHCLRVSKALVQGATAEVLFPMLPTARHTRGPWIRCLRTLHARPG